MLHIIGKAEEGISLDIYGPVKDENYWGDCEALLDGMPGRVTYKGDVQPENVQQLISQYDAFILLTKGENFGHALYESLSVGRPVITSNFTPWTHLQQKQGGWNVSLDNKNDCIALLNKLKELNSVNWMSYCLGAYAIACNYYRNLHIQDQYNKLFPPVDEN